MFKLLGGLANYLKYRDIVTDCAIFRLHNTFTCALLMACSLIITANQFVGNPIQCIVDGLPTHVINTYCWISSTFTMPDAFKRQAIACYTPKVLWEAFEGKLMQTLVMGLNIGVCHEKEKNAKKEVILGYIQGHMKSEEPQEDRVDPMVYVFPRVTKCIFHKYGASGTIQKHDSMCILPLNIVNEKTYIFIWFWFMILATMLTVLIIYRIIIIACPSMRPRILHAKNRSIPIEACRSLCSKVDLGDWWILLMLGTNMDSIIYRELISELVKKIEPTSSGR
nr:innexin inx1-like [Leptinotarsa decemlineata]